MLPATLVPILLALVAAAGFALQAVLARFSLRYVDAQAGALVTIATAALVFWALAPLHMRGEFWRSPALWVFAINGLVHPTLSMLLSFEANRRMGATVSATIAATAPLFATAGAVAALGEVLSAPILLGTLGTVGGIIVLSWSRPGTAHWALAALFFPVGAAVVRAFNHVWSKFGLELLSEPLFAATVSFTVASVLSAVAFRVRHGRRRPRLPLRGVLWNIGGGLSAVVAILAMYTALTTGRVVVVSPVVNTYPLFTLGWALLFRQEVLAGRVLVGVVLVVGGVALISTR